MSLGTLQCGDHLRPDYDDYDYDPISTYNPITTYDPITTCAPPCAEQTTTSDYLRKASRDDSHGVPLPGGALAALMRRGIPIGPCTTHTHSCQD